MKFFNREKEIREILNIINTEPNLIYFIYGPINRGKSTLVRKIIRNKIDKSRYIPFLIDFRLKNIVNVDSIIETLFEIDYTSKAKAAKSYIKKFIKNVIKDFEDISFNLSTYAKFPTLKLPKNLFYMFLKEKENVGNVYSYIEDVFREIRKIGKVPILILDELQMLKEITLNGSRPLLKSFFQFLVAITKVEHLVHVFCISSDSLFIEYVYKVTELEGRARYILVDDFEKEEAINFLDFLSKEILKGEKNLSAGEKEKIYNLVGGKPLYLVSIIS